MNETFFYSYITDCPWFINETNSCKAQYNKETNEYESCDCESCAIAYWLEMKEMPL